jgi:hypothetical protein
MVEDLFLVTWNGELLKREKVPEACKKRERRRWASARAKDSSMDAASQWDMQSLGPMVSTALGLRDVSE